MLPRQQLHETHQTIARLWSKNMNEEVAAMRLEMQGHLDKVLGHLEQAGGHANALDEKVRVGPSHYPRAKDGVFHHTQPEMIHSLLN